MLALQKLLFPTDFSDCAKTAEKYAVQLAEQFQAELHVLHVLPDVLMYAPDPGSGLIISEEYLATRHEAAVRALNQVLGDATQGGVKIVRELRTGNAFTEIIKYADEHDIDLIVVGRHGRGALAHLLLGSVAEKVVRKAHCPVLSVHQQGHQFTAA